MTIAQIVNRAIVPLRPTDSAYDALVAMEQLQCSQLPVVEKNRLSGFLTKQVAAAVSGAQKIHDLELLTPPCVMRVSDPFYDVFRLAQEHNIDMVAALDQDDAYCGVVTVRDAAFAAAQLLNASAEGSMLILAVNALDYSLTEIARLVEENNAKITSLIVAGDPKNDRQLRVSLRIDRSDLTHILATLERFGYAVVGRYQPDDAARTDAVNERFDILMRYINA